MGFALGVFTSDPNLLRCELLRLREEIGPSEGAEPLGAGWYADGNVLLQRYASVARPAAVDRLEGVLESEALLVHSAALPVGKSVEENVQPFRFRQWLFACHGQPGGGERLRALVLEGMPEHLQRVVRGSEVGELAFALFLLGLKEGGLIEEALGDARRVGEALAHAGRRLQARVQEAGGRAAPFALFATNGQVLAAVQLGEAPLLYRLLEGSPSCDRCQLGDSHDQQTLRLAHLRRRTVAVSTRVADAKGWIALQSGKGIAVGRSLNPELLG